MMIVQGVFRSGTSVLFRTLAHDSAWTCYYEPLHPDLLDHVSEAEAANPSHPKSSLYAPYQAVQPRLQEAFSPSFSTDHATLEAEDSAAPLRSYLTLLTENRATTVLQFNRAFWMTSWLQSAVPEACFLHLVRDPRSVVWSQLTTSSGSRVRMDWPLLGRVFSFSSGDLSKVFSPHAYHGAYEIKDYLRLGLNRFSDRSDDIRAWAYDCLHAAQSHRPYVQALAVWGAQVRVCHHEAQAAFGENYRCLRYEDLCDTPISTLKRVYDLCDRPLPSSVRQYAGDHIHRESVAAWEEVDGAREHFRRGVRQAGIAPVLEDVGYDHLLE